MASGAGPILLIVSRAAGMAAVARYLYHVLIDRIAAVVTAVRRVSGRWTTARLVFTFILVSHKAPLGSSNFATSVAITQ